MMAGLWGVLHGWALSSPWNGQAQWWLQLLAMAWLAHRLAHGCTTARQAFWQSWFFATGWLSASLWWLYISMHFYGGLPALLAGLAVVGFSGFLALFYAVAGALWVACLTFARWHGRAGGLPVWAAIVLFAALWLLAELVRATLWTGFPWSSIGYAHIDGPLVGGAPWIGVYGIAALAAALAAFFALTPSWLLKLTVAGLLLLKAWAMNDPHATVNQTTSHQAGLHQTTSHQTTSHHASDKPFQKATSSDGSVMLTVRLLQGNIPQSEKFDRNTGVAQSLSWYRAQILEAVQASTKDQQGAPLDLVVTPETAIPLLPDELPPGYWTELEDAITNQLHTALLVGAPLGSMKAGYTNSVIGLLPQGQRAPAGHPTSKASFYRYDKYHLVPFGEFIPRFFRWFTDQMQIPLGDFHRGTLNPPSFAHAKARFAVLICFEDLFGEELARRFLDPQTAPTVLVNVSNMGWFGAGMAIDQHLNISRMRALEFGRPVIRATNTGATVIVNHRGHVTHGLPRAVRGVLTGSVEAMSHITPYAHWLARYGLQPLWLGALGALMAVLGAWAWASRRVASDVYLPAKS